MDLNELKGILSAVNGPTKVHVKYRVDLSSKYAAKYKKAPNHKTIYKVTEVDSITGAKYEDVFQKAREVRFNKDGSTRRSGFSKPNDFPAHTVTYNESKGNYYLELYTSMDHAKNNRTQSFEMYDENDQLEATFDWDYLKQLDEQVKAESESGNGIFIASFWNRDGEAKAANPTGDPTPDASVEYGYIIPLIENILELTVVGPADEIKEFNPEVNEFEQEDEPVFEEDFDPDIESAEDLTFNESADNE